MFCEHCGNKLMDSTSEFCEKCGHKIEGNAFVDEGTVLSTKDDTIIIEEDKTILSSVSPQKDDINSVWPEWKIEEELGKGSFGTVYKAIRNDNNVKSYAAIKVINIPTDRSEVESLRSEGLTEEGTRTYFKGIVDDFVNEIQLMESLKGIQNIVSVEDYKVVEKTNTVGWIIYIRMELLTPFTSYLKGKELSEAEVINFGIDICTALEICGKRGIIHRDIKIENIFMNDFGDYKLGDFGIARKLENVTGGMSQKGTYNYMAPEVINSSTYDARVDICSLGLVLYRLMNKNRLPFIETDAQVMNPIERKNAVDRRLRGEKLSAPCNASKALADVILKACAFNPENRFANASEMKQALESVKNGTYIFAPINNYDKTDRLDYDKTDRIPNTVVKTEVSNASNINTFGKKKKSKLPLIIACLVLVAALAVAAVFILPKVFNDDAGEGKESEIVVITDADKDNLTKKEQNEVKEIVTGAESDAAAGNYEEALKKIEEGIKEFPDSETLKNKSEEYEKKIQDAKISEILSEAKVKADAGNYEDALKKVEAGLKIYPNSTELKNKADEYKAAYDIKVKDDILLQAAEYAATEDYVSAINVIKNAQKKYGEKEEFTEALDTYEKEYFKQIKKVAIAEAEELAGEKKYLEAIKKIDAALAIVENDIELTSKKSLYETNYIDDVISEADNFVGNKKYTQAVALLEEALGKYPANKTLKDKLEHIKKIKPTDISKLTPINQGSGGFDSTDWNSGVPTDPFGRVYSTSENFIIFTGAGNGGNIYKEYRLYGNYSSLSGFVCPYNDMHENGEMTIQILGDDRVLYETKVVRKMDPLNFNVDITDVNYLKIKVSYSEWRRTSVILGDVMLHN